MPLHKTAFHAWGIDPKDEWVRVTAYDGICEQLHTFLCSLDGGYGYVAFSNSSHNRPLQTSFEGALAVKVEGGCLMRSSTSCSQWPKSPSASTL